MKTQFPCCKIPLEVYNEVFILECPYCGSTFSDYEDAMECSRDCVRDTADEPDSTERYECEYCLKEYRHASKAEECEAMHKEQKDRHYDDYKLKENFDKLEQAAKVPGQKRLA